MRQAALATGSTLQVGKWSRERVTDSPKVTQLGHGGVLCCPGPRWRLLLIGLTFWNWATKGREGQNSLFINLRQTDHRKKGRGQIQIFIDKCTLCSNYLLVPSDVGQSQGKSLRKLNHPPWPWTPHTPSTYLGWTNLKKRYAIRDCKKPRFKSILSRKVSEFKSKVPFKQTI